MSKDKEVTLTALVFLSFTYLFNTPGFSQQIYVTWNGTRITGPILIFQDEIQVINSTVFHNINNSNHPGALVCGSQSSSVAWYMTDGTRVPDIPAALFQQTRETMNGSSLALLSRGMGSYRNISDQCSGLWMCRVNESGYGEVMVAIYQRENSAGILTTATTLLINPLTDFLSDIPYFTIIGKTQGGPPTSRNWTKDGMVLTSSETFNISIVAIAENSESRYQHSVYESTLVVMGRQPGLYQYSATNTLSTLWTDTIAIEVTDIPSHLSARQTGDSMVEVSWIPPLIPPRLGYQITISGLSGFATEVTTVASPCALSLQPDTYWIQLRALSEHYPSDVLGPVNITIRSLLSPIVALFNLAPTSVSINFTQPDDSLATDYYVVSLVLARAERQLCHNSSDGITVNTANASIDFVDLFEFSVYNLTVTVTNNAYRTTKSLTLEFVTLSTLPSGPPQDIQYSKSSRDIALSWAPIVCSQCNGPILDYMVEFQSLEDDVVNVTVSANETFTAGGLVPSTNYTFRVAGVNVNGTGPFSNALTILTDEDVPGPVSSLTARPTEFSIVLTWSAPQEPNGVILSYEVTYSVNRSTLVTANTTNLSTTFTVPTLTIGVMVSSISVSAYTLIGQGEEALLEDITVAQLYTVDFRTVAGAVVAVLVVTAMVVLPLLLAIKLEWCCRLSQGPDTEVTTTKMGPVISKFPEDTYAIEGKAILLPVSVQGNPLPSTTWYYEGNELKPDHCIEIQQNASLFISYLQLKHTGHYCLSVTNPIGNAERTFNLFVKLKELRIMLMLQNGTAVKPVPLEKFDQYVAENHANNNKGFKNQFSALYTGTKYTKFIGTHIKNMQFNRYSNIIVYDHNRIPLSSMPNSDEWNGDYINACYIDGYMNTREFIATQGPKPQTIIDFWRLVWQERPPTIVMLTNLKEDNKRKCNQYWPDGGSINYGPFKIILTEKQFFTDYCVRTFILNLLHNPNKYWEFRQYHYLSWTDRGTPEDTAIMLFLKEVTAWHKKVVGPMLVHCSAGVGRTGVFICLCNVLDQIKKEKVVDIAGAINKMRHQRMKMVNFMCHYIFLHDVILKSAMCGVTEVHGNSFKHTLRKWLDQNLESPDGLTMLEKQFRVLQQLSPRQNNSLCQEALKYPERNRSKNHLPGDRNRVVLVNETPDYINAVYVPGYKKQKAYIISEGPMATTVRNWFKIICDNRCGAVVMLSEITEKAKECSIQYWPMLVNGNMILFEDYRIHLIQEQEHFSGVTTRILNILHLKTKKYHQVIQFHITCWKPNGHWLDSNCLVEVIDEVSSVQKKTKNTPILVHCSDTITRSAMFCAILTIIDRWKSEGVIDIFQVIKDMRIPKPLAVPKSDHYQLIYSMVQTYLSVHCEDDYIPNLILPLPPVATITSTP